MNEDRDEQTVRKPTTCRDPIEVSRLRDGMSGP
jgi:hypothetical protein